MTAALAELHAQRRASPIRCAFIATPRAFCSGATRTWSAPQMSTTAGAHGIEIARRVTGGRRRVHEPAHAGVGRGRRPRGLRRRPRSGDAQHLRRRCRRSVAARRARPASARPTTSRSADARCRARAATPRGAARFCRARCSLADDIAVMARALRIPEAALRDKRDVSCGMPRRCAAAGVDHRVHFAAAWPRRCGGSQRSQPSERG